MHYKKMNLLRRVLYRHRITRIENRIRDGLLISYIAALKAKTIYSINTLSTWLMFRVFHLA